MPLDSTQIIVLINETPESIEISEEEYEIIMEKIIEFKNGKNKW